MKNDNEQDNEISNTFLVFLLFVNKLKTFYYCRYEFHYIFLYYVYHWHLVLWESDIKCLFKIKNKYTKVNNKSTITMSITYFWYLYC